MKKLVRLLLCLIIIPAALHYPQQEVTFIMHWIPQAQFAGYYVGYELGIYKKYGIDIKLVPGGPRTSAPVMLEKGEVDFASLWLTNAMQVYDNGTKIVNIAQLINNSALMLIAKKSSGIEKPEDMNGKKIGIWGGDFQIQPMAFFKKFNLDVNIVQQGNSINLFFLDGIDVTTAMWYNEYHTILNAGINEDELNTFFFSAYGLNFPEEGLYCLEETFINNPDLCKAFVAASLEGWQYAIMNPDETLDMLYKYVRKEKLPFNKSHQRWMLNRMRDLMFPKGDISTFGHLNKENFLLVGQKLKEAELIITIPEYEKFYNPMHP